MAMATAMAMAPTPAPVPLVDAEAAVAAGVAGPASVPLLARTRTHPQPQPRMIRCGRAPRLELDHPARLPRKVAASLKPIGSALRVSEPAPPVPLRISTGMLMMTRR